MFRRDIGYDPSVVSLILYLPLNLKWLTSFQKKSTHLPEFILTRSK